MDSTNFLFHLTLLLCLPTIPRALTKHNIITDQSVLLALKSHAFDPSNLLTNNWTTKVSVCNWIGVTCSTRHQRVVALNIVNLGLQGSIPPEIGNLSFLNFIDISGNNFKGSLPQEMVHLRRLKYINLSMNKFSGNFPSWFGFLPNLQQLYLMNNSFTGTLPVSLFNATKLEAINMWSNHLQGNIPREIGNLRNLKMLVMERNQFEGSIPLTIFNTSSLQSIAFTQNTLSGNLPSNICFKLPKLRAIYLSQNELSGPVQSRFNNCSELQILSLSFNNFSGPIPREIGNLTLLVQMFLGRNNLRGEIPPEIGNLLNLEVFESAESYLAGPLPAEITNLRKLKRLILLSNGLSGPILPTIFNISSLTIMSFTDNKLSGSLPPSMGHKLPNLEILALGANNLNGSILDSISNCTKLTYLDLIDNQFTGSIPATLGALRFLERLNIAGNYLTTYSSSELRFLSSLTSCRSLSLLDVSENPLNGVLPHSLGNFSSALQYFYATSSGIQGTIPNGIGNLSGLLAMSLRNNHLTGALPMTFTGLWNLQALDLGTNKILGSIPKIFCNFRKLSLLGLRENQFSGQVPECFGNITSLRYLYLNHNRLNSSMPISLGSLKDILHLYVHSNSLSGCIPVDIGNLKAAIAINLAGNKFSGNIPISFGGLQSLIKLSLNNNELEGPIPETFGNMVSLELLDLSYNNLTGEIPTSLGSLLQLKYFNVSFNNLQGEIPKNGSFMNFTNESFKSNGALCGGGPNLKFPPCPLHSHKSSRMKGLVIVAYTLILTALAIGSIIMIVLAVNKRQRGKKSPAEIDLMPPTINERVSYYDLQHATNGFSERNLIATGSYGSVYKGMLRDGMILAIKIFNLQLEGAFQSFDRECEVLRNLRHRNLVKVISCCSSLEFKALVLEYMSNGSLEKWLYSHNHFLNCSQRLNIIIDVASALDYLHHGYSFPIVHCDLKPSNILLDESMTGRLGDFGISKLFAGGETMVQTKTLATIGYIAPEFGSEGIVSTRCDVYSFGIVLMETFSRKKPTDQMFVEDWGLKDWVMDSIQNSTSHFIDHGLITPEDQNSEATVQCLSSIMELALRCTAESPDQRIDIIDALEELKKIKVKFLFNYKSTDQKITMR